MKNKNLTSDEDCKPYNGLKSDMNLFSKFVFIYETRLKNIVKDDEFKRISPGAYHLFIQDFQRKVKYAKISEIPDYTENTTPFLYFTKSRVQKADFCRHLRNSFVHALIVKQNKKLFITDKNSRNQITCTGFLQHCTVLNFVIKIVEDFEL